MKMMKVPPTKPSKSTLSRIKKHEGKETPAMEHKETPAWQRFERKKGIEKHASKKGY